MIKELVKEMMGILLSKLPQDEVEKWITMETEHTNGDREAARQIVSDHILEHGKDYYPKYIEFINGLEKRSI